MAFEWRRLALQNTFQEQVYNKHVIKQACTSVRDAPREILLQEKKSLRSSSGTDTTSVVFSTRFSNQFSNIKHIISQQLPILFSDPGYKGILSKGAKYVVKKALTVGNIVSPSLFTTKQEVRTWLHTAVLVSCFFKCNATRCSSCRYTEDLHFYHTQFEWHHVLKLNSQLIAKQDM